MNKRYFILSISFLVFITVYCKAQNDLVYEIPFSTEKKLLVFKGRLNGIETDFAFDTGAAEGIATTNDEKRNGVERKKSTQRIVDGNGKITNLQTVITKQLSVAGFTFQNVKASITDMQYLYCMNLYLLGADVINQLNWEIDFKKRLLKVSKKRFETTGEMTVIPVKYSYNTPRIKLRINDIPFDDVLIDFGFNGVMTIPKTDKINNLVETKKAQHLVTAKMASTFAAGGLSKPSLTETTLLNDIKINKTDFNQIPADFKTDTDFKIGLQFFSSTCEKVIINNSEKKYYLLLKEKNTFVSAFPVSFLLKDNQLKTSSITIADKQKENDFEIGEEVKSINGKTAGDFKSDCDFLTWYFISIATWDRLLIEKRNGQKVEVERSQYR
ncbi:MAG: retroviral-like aspartic protease family protein [Chitinophagaceae bacterium]|nr:retroviral-like aspartic protease family protein [Chitinophagaceae bacterium]